MPCARLYTHAGLMDMVSIDAVVAIARLYEAKRSSISEAYGEPGSKTETIDNYRALYIVSFT